MNRSDTANTAQQPGVHQRVEQMIHEYIADVRAPTTEEVGRLVYELVTSKVGLELQNEELQTTQRQLEKYRDRYVDLYDFAPLGYITLDKDGYVQEINLAGANMLAVEPTTAIGYPFVDYVAARDSDKFLQHVRRCVGNRTEVTSEFTLLSRGGKSISVQLRSIPVTDPDGDVSLCKTAVTDITDRKRAEEALRASERNYREIFDAVNEMIVVHEVASGIILDANAKMCETFGYSAEEIRELTVGDISLGNPPYAQEDAARWLAKTAQEGPQLFEWLCKKKNGDLFWAEVNLKRAVIGGVERLLAVVREITERKRREEELRLAHEKLIEEERERKRVEAELVNVKGQLGRRSR